jgi:hypothetical protein
MPIFPIQPVRVARISLPATALTVSTEPAPHDRKVKLTAVYFAYSAAVTLSVTITLNSGVAAAYDLTLAALPLVGDRYAWWVPDTPIPLGLGDTIDVLAPSGGGVITSAVQILYEDELPTQDGAGGYQYEQVSRE